MIPVVTIFLHIHWTDKKNKQSVSTCDIRFHNVLISDLKLTIIGKRLDARYDWLTKSWKSVPYILVDGSDGCNITSDVRGAVALVSAEGNCSYFTKVLLKIISFSKILYAAVLNMGFMIFWITEAQWYFNNNKAIVLEN